MRSFFKPRLQFLSFALPAFFLDAYLPAVARSPAEARSAKPDDNPWQRITKPTLRGRNEAVGFYSAGCLENAQKINKDGDGFHVMRLSRNRFWGHSSLISFLTRFSSEAKIRTGDFVLLGDTAQPRGGPFTTGHASHQIGLDADIWLTQRKEARLSKAPTSAQRENISAITMLNPRGQKYPLRLNPPGVPDLNMKVWTASKASLLKLAASQPEVDRIFVHPYIKKALCQEFGIYGLANADWLRKIRPWWGHDAHFHVRLKCPADSPDCRPQESTPPGDGCRDDLAWWFSTAAQEEWKRIQNADSTFRMPKLPARCSEILKQ